VKVLFDHNVPHKFRRSLVHHDVKTADEMGWAELENGELLKAAEAAEFAVMVTCDKNISYQQNLKSRALALVILSTNNWQVLQSNMPRVLLAVNRAQAGSFKVVNIVGQPNPSCDL
jgi:predicted nuclease of predicted toxin-antitoxin system